MSDLDEVLCVGLGEREVGALDDVHRGGVVGGRLRAGKVGEEGGGRGEGELGPVVVEHRMVYRGSKGRLVGKYPRGLVG